MRRRPEGRKTQSCSLPQLSVAPAAVLRLAVLPLSLSCTQEIILPLRSPAPQIYYSSPSPLSQQDGSGATRRKGKSKERCRCLPAAFICSVASFTATPHCSSHRMTSRQGGVGLLRRLAGGILHQSIGVLWLHFQYDGEHCESLDDSKASRLELVLKLAHCPRGRQPAHCTASTAVHRGSLELFSP